MQGLDSETDTITRFGEKYSEMRRKPTLKRIQEIRIILDVGYGVSLLVI